MSACSPGILNGFRDFTRYGRVLEKYKEPITAVIRELYGNSGKSVYEIALAEWHYQNNRCFDALVLVTGTIPLIEYEDDMRCLFVAMALQMRILLVNGQTKSIYMMDMYAYLIKVRCYLQMGKYMTGAGNEQ